ncbi:MAG: hypothetical protein HDR04_03790 [Lachnospiraceae bacterium]|nr:hypothetical protein [Lachnospiraceae bacterium]
MEKKYDNCISLGWFCGTASSMGRCGLRKHSGPFDWYFSDLESVLKVMEKDFTDFMKKENLLVDKNDNTVFYDTKYGFCCNHDISFDFEKEYPLIYEKYMRRSERFLHDVQFPTCFIRAVRSEKEIQFIEENESYIYRIVKRGNSDNEIIFLLLKGMRNLSDKCKFQWFRLGITRYVGNIYEMRTMFESSESFLKYCRESILTEEVIKRNIEFDKEHLYISDKFNVFINRLAKENYNIIPILKDYYPGIDREGVFLWGMGTYGTLMVQYLLKNTIKVNGIIDNNPNKIGTCFAGIPIVAFSEIESDRPNIFISIKSEQSIDEIIEQISARYLDARVYKMADLFEHPIISQML